MQMLAQSAEITPDRHHTKRMYVIDTYPVPPSAPAQVPAVFPLYFTAEPVAGRRRQSLGEEGR